jgi:spore coat polysaccharide biosynthesis protein SpsF
MKVAAVLPVILSRDEAVSLVLDRKIAGRLALDHLLARVARVDQLSGIVVATTSRASDDAVEAFCRARGIACSRGAEDAAENQLGLVLAASRSIGAGAALLVRADSPLIDPAILRRVVDLVLMTDGMLDFVGTTLAQSYPRGMDVEAVTVAALEDADRRCADSAPRGDAAAYPRETSRLYRLLTVTAEEGLARPDLGFDLRSDADCEAIAKILDRFDGRSDIPLGEIIAFVDGRPE